MPTDLVDLVLISVVVLGNLLLLAAITALLALLKRATTRAENAEHLLSLRRPTGADVTVRMLARTEPLAGLSRRIKVVER